MPIYLHIRKTRTAHSNKIKTATAPIMTGSKGNALLSFSWSVFSSEINKGNERRKGKKMVVKLHFGTNNLGDMLKEERGDFYI